MAVVFWSAAVLSQDITQSQGFGGVQLGTGVLTESQCVDLVEGNKAKAVKDVVPCECRRRSEVAASCHPTCCPVDRCWGGNAAEWTPWEQTVCRAETTLGNTKEDGVCIYNGGNPNVVSVNGTSVNFALSTLAAHSCVDLMLSACLNEAGTFHLALPTGARCHQTCPPQPLTPCTSSSCTHNRGRTHPYIRSWTVPDIAPGVGYLLTCVTVSSLNTGTEQEVNQTQYLPTAFYSY